MRYTSNGTSFAAGNPEPWSPAPVSSIPSLYWHFDLAPDGKRLLTFPASMQTAEEQPSFHIRVLLNFFDELRRKVP